MVSRFKCIALPGLAGLLLVVLAACGPKIPEYEGRTLEEWVRRAEGPVLGPAHTAARQRREAFGALERVGAPAVPALARMVGNTDPDIAAGAVGALKGIGPAGRAAVPDLIAALAPRRPPRIRRAIPGALAAIDPHGEAAQLELVARLADSDDAVFRAAWSALDVCFRENGPATEAVARRFAGLREAGLNNTRQEMIRRLPSAAGHGWP